MKGVEWGDGERRKLEWMMAGIYSIPPRLHNIFIISLSLCGTVRADVWWIVMRQRDGGWQCCSPRDHVPVSQVTLSRGVTSHVTRMDRHYTSQAAQQIVEVRSEHLQTEQLRSISAVFEHLNIWTFEHLNRMQNSEKKSFEASWVMRGDGKLENCEMQTFK